MKDILRFGFTLLLVAVIAAGSLSWVNSITKPKILEIQANNLQQGLSKVLPGAKDGVIVSVPYASNPGVIQYYRGYAQKDSTDLVGYACLVDSKGYSSTIRTLVGMDTTGTILAIEILFQQETPGLGTKCQEIRTGETSPWFQHQFIGKAAAEVALDKDNGTIVSITGATITSRAITTAIADSARTLFSVINQ